MTTSSGKGKQQSATPRRSLSPSSGATALPLDDHLFRKVWGDTASRLVARFGAGCIEEVEDAIQDAFLAAFKSWPLRGTPDDPTAWIFTAARNRLVDILRHRNRQVSDEAVIERLAAREESAHTSTFSSEVGDDRLAFIFACCDPALPADVRTVLTLRLVCGLSVREIAAAVLTEEATIAQRLHRAKRRLLERKAPIAIPTGQELRERLASVQDVIYMLFSEGYSAHYHENLIRYELCAEALEFCRLLLRNELTDTASTRALTALICLQSARLPARTDSLDDLVVLSEQDRAKWDGNLIAEGLNYLESAASGSCLSRFHLEAGIAACHTVAGTFAATDWQAISYYYDQLCELYPSPIYELNRAIAVSYLRSPEEGLTLLNRQELAATLDKYYLYHATLADLHARIGSGEEAVRSYIAAIARAPSATERRFLQRRLDACR